MSVSTVLRRACAIRPLRKVYALREVVIHREIIPVKVGEAFNLADIFTKYLSLDRWRVHVRRLLNRVGLYNTS